MVNLLLRVAGIGEGLSDVLHAIERCQNCTQHLGCEVLRAMAGRCNVVVHEYSRIVAELIFDIIGHQLGPPADLLVMAPTHDPAASDRSVTEFGG